MRAVWWFRCLAAGLEVPDDLPVFGEGVDRSQLIRGKRPCRSCKDLTVLRSHCQEPSWVQWRWMPKTQFGHRRSKHLLGRGQWLPIVVLCREHNVLSVEARGKGLGYCATGVKFASPPTMLFSHFSTSRFAKAANVRPPIYWDRSEIKHQSSSSGSHKLPR